MMIVERILPPSLTAESGRALREKLFFASAAIHDVDLRDNAVRIFVDDSAEPGVGIDAKIDRLLDRFVRHEPGREGRVVCERRGSGRSMCPDVMAQLEARGALVRLGEGQYGLAGIALALLEYFDRSIREIGRALQAEEHRYPSIIPIRAMQRVRYLASRPECLNFVSHLREDIDGIDAFASAAGTVSDRVELGAAAETDCLNAVAVCLHAFHECQDRDLGPAARVVGAAGRCMRYESRSMDGLRRLRDFTMREIVCLGTRDVVAVFRRQAFDAAVERLERWGLESRVVTASDVFFTGEFAGQAAFQKTFELKYELRAALPGGDDLAIGSINDHRDFIGTGFGIRAGARPAHSSCLAYGLERCVFAFLTQHGLDPSGWPDDVARATSGAAA